MPPSICHFGNIILVYNVPNLKPPNDQDEFMCDIEALMEGGCSQVEHWFDNEEKEFIISAMKNRQDMVQDNSSNAQIWSIFMSV